MKRATIALSLLLLASCQTIDYNVGADQIVVPKPNSVIVDKGGVSLASGIKIETTGAEEIAKYLEERLKERFNIEPAFFGEKISIKIDESMASEAYKMEISSRGIEITASRDGGALYGVQTLLQMVEAGAKDGEYLLSYQKIEDAPRFHWRSYMLDESRHFFGQENIYQLLDEMATLKMNVLHWHLTDDAGWRVEVKQYPKLTEIGSKRKDTETGTWGSGTTAGVPHEGFYTQEQIKEIVKYAKLRNIKIVPEIEMPGHASAAIAAYPWLSTAGKQIEVPVQFGKHYEIFDVIKPEVVEFLQNVVSEMITLFETDVVHIGGDEVRFNQWEDDPKMVAYKKAKGFSSFMDIQIEFTNNMSNFIESKGVSMMGWNEILGKNLHSDDRIYFAETSTKVAQNVVVQFWKGDLEWMKAAAEGGYKLVNSHHVSTYLDYAHTNITLEKAYAFNPIPLDLDPKYHSNIIGSGCQMWTEWVPNKAKLDDMTYPRIAAFAEVGWTELDNKDYSGFTLRLKPIAERWAEQGIKLHQYEELK